MFGQIINNIVDLLKTENKIFSFGVYKDRFDTAIGVDDSYPYYFFIADDVDENADNATWEASEETGCGSYEITGSFKLIAALQNVDLNKGLQVLVSQLENNFDATITASSTHSEAIYKDEYPDSDSVPPINILRIKFQLTTEVNMPICEEGLCLEDCL